jgi:DNA polymerase-3 subunit alpha
MILPSVTTHYSLLSGFIKMDEAARRCAELGYSHCLLSDDNLGGVVEFVSEMKANGVVPIVGLKTPEGHYIVKTLAGYRTLIRIASGETPDYESKDLQLYREGELDLMEVRYAEKNDAEMLRILLCSKHKTTMRKVKEIDIGDDKRFLDNDSYHFISPSGESSKNKKLISELEDYTIFCKPKLPKIHDDEAEYLTELCRAGWRAKFSGLRGETKDLYVARVKEELGVINGFGLSGYFLIVADIVDFIRKNGWLTPIGRGSACGSLVSYLTGITGVDPIPYGLLFARFLNSGRFSKDNVSLPDIDLDVPSDKRDAVIDYIKNKYGHDKVYQMITFGRLQGRSAIKEVSRVYERLSFAELNEITDSLPMEASISDDLEEMDVKSVVMWTLENNPGKLAKWCTLNESGELAGDLSDLFNLAIRLEGTYKSRGVHPAGVIISNEPLINDAPLVKNKDGDLVVGFEMGDLDKIGLVKFDVLGVNLLDKIMEICRDE